MHPRPTSRAPASVYRCDLCGASLDVPGGGLADVYADHQRACSTAGLRRVG